MNDARLIYASCAAAVMLTLAGAACAQPSLPTLPPPKPGAQLAPATAAAINAAEAPMAYPTFASIPPLPTDVRPPSAWKAAVIAVQSEGAQVSAEAAGGWTLHDTEAWAEGERAEAAPPPPVTPPSQADAEAFAAALRARATPPPPLHHAAEARPARSHP